MTFQNGDLYDIGQTVNGVSTFVFSQGRWHYYADKRVWEYEYDQDDLSKLIQDDELNGWDEVNYLGNILK